jgi:hypothetical protein
MLSVLREQLKVINPWLEEDQVDEVVKQLTANFPSTNLLQNNRHGFNQLLKNTSVSENRKTGEKSPSVKFIDFKNRDNNRFVAVCQFKIRILGSEHHIIPDIVLFLNGLPVVVVECKSPKVKDNVNFNWRLIKAPMFVIDYVIVHELAHLLEANHTPRFWNIVRAKAPSAEKAKMWLKQHGQILEEEV